MEGYFEHCVLSTLEELYTERTGTQTYSETFIAIQITELLKFMLCYSGDLGSRLDTLDGIETEKLFLSPNCFIVLKFISLVQLMLGWSMSMSPGQCSDRDRKDSDVK